jgi:hypothetical protein
MPSIKKLHDGCSESLYHISRLKKNGLIRGNVGAWIGSIPPLPEMPVERGVHLVADVPESLSRIAVHLRREM